MHQKRILEDSLLIETLKGNPGDRPPVWYMRQAGRVLPSYLKLREKYSFWQLMKKPELAAEVTLLPVHDLGVDAAILFSDILVIPYAMGMGLEFTDNGPVFEKPLIQFDAPSDLLKPDTSKLGYIYSVIDKIVETRPSGIPLIGFCGAPLTVLCYMLQGIGKKADFPDAIRFIYQNRKEVKKLISAVTELSISYAREQIRHGIDIFQLFETHAGLIPEDLYQELFFPSIREISKAVKEADIPFIYFPKGLGTGISAITPDMCDVLGIDWQTPLSVARKLVNPAIALQGNLDPRLLYASKKEIEREFVKFIAYGSKHTNWIFNLGHGFLADTPFENANFLTQLLKDTDWNRL